MTLKVETLESRIRQKASDELREELHNASESLRKKCSMGYSIDLEVNGKVQLWNLIEMIEKRLHQEFVLRREDEAIAEFVSKVESLQSQINELRDTVQS